MHPLHVPPAAPSAQTHKIRLPLPTSPDELVDMLDLALPAAPAPTADLVASDIAAVKTAMQMFVKDETIGLGLDFSVWSWSRAEHLGMYLGMFVRQGLVRDSVALQAVFDFACEIAQNYLDNPYHSFLHAVDMTYMTYYLVHDMGVKEQLDLSSADFAALLVAAIAHDVLHPGTNNNYQVNAATPIAKLFHNQSVLENQSLQFAKSLLQSKHAFLPLLHFDDIPQEVPRQDIVSKIIDTISDLILKTDMICHFALLEKLANFADAHETVLSLPTSRAQSVRPETDLLKLSLLRHISDSQSGAAQPGDHSAAGSAGGSARNSGIIATALKSKLDGELSHHGSTTFFASDSSLDALPKIIIKDPLVKQSMLNAILHAADISNPARPFKLCQKWSAQVTQEFFYQGDLERKNGLPITPNMDRDTTHQAQIQTAFTDFIVRPYFETLAEVFPRMVSFADIIHENSRQWETMLPSPPPQIVMSEPASEATSASSVSAPSAVAAAVAAVSPPQPATAVQVGTPRSPSPTHAHPHPHRHAAGTESPAAVGSPAASNKRKHSQDELGSLRSGIFGSGSATHPHPSASPATSHLATSPAFATGRRLSMAAGTVEIPDTIERLFNRLKSRNHSNSSSQHLLNSSLNSTAGFGGDGGGGGSGVGATPSSIFSASLGGPAMSIFRTGNLRPVMGTGSRLGERGSFTSLATTQESSSFIVDEEDEQMDDVKDVPELPRSGTRQRRIVSLPDTSSSHSQMAQGKAASKPAAASTPTST
ncbi:hypothetical protein HK105_202973 [Polyrhizophydium stewartii]|uniref:Phosphodiesterase n=1 Tax=Polyrhizophydium stewartii TaxID=2732419 RepID=A0ABR4NCT4_9FUNG